MTDPYYGLWDSAPAANSEQKSSETDPSIPDGEHRARIVAFECFESKKGDVWMKFTFAVLGGMFDGRTLVRMVAPLGKRTDEKDWRERQVGFARKDLRALLGRVPAIEELMDHETKQTGPVAVNIVNAIVNVAKQTKQGRDGEDRIIVYINDLVQGPDEGVGDDPGSWPEDDDAPIELHGEADPDRGHDGTTDRDNDVIPF